MRAVRIFFSKTETARFISHLDLTRFFARAFRRAGIEVWYTEGYNPRLYMQFALSLPLGAQGMNECFDVKVLDDISNDELLQKLNTVSVPGLKFLRAAEPVNLPSAISFAKYHVVIPSSSIELLTHITTVTDSGSLMAEKKTKKGTINSINLLDGLSDFTVISSDDTLLLDFVLPAGSEFNISPLLFCESLLATAGFDYREALISRVNLLLENKEIYS